MKVYTRYPALAPAIKRAGYEPVLLEPLHLEDGPVRVEVAERLDPRKPRVVVVSYGLQTLVLETLGEPTLADIIKEEYARDRSDGVPLREHLLRKPKV